MKYQRAVRQDFLNAIIAATAAKPTPGMEQHGFGWHLFSIVPEGGTGKTSLFYETTNPLRNYADDVEYIGPHTVKVTIEVAAEFAVVDREFCARCTHPWRVHDSTRCGECGCKRPPYPVG